MQAKSLLTILIVTMSCVSPNAAHAFQWQVGFAKTDVTPGEPIRLSGYASRGQAFDSVADPLHARAMAIVPDGQLQSSAVVIVSIDSIAVTASMTLDVATWAAEKFGIERSRLVLCSTHSHAAPHLANGLNNLYSTPLTSEETQRIQNYTDQLIAKLKQTIAAAFNVAKPAKLSIATTTANFATQRRTIREGKWAGFGETPEGACDRRVRVLECRSMDDKVLGGAYMYACHCTTLGGDFNQVSGDWAGLSASRLEAIYPQAVFLPVIGCGADANPKPRTGYQFAEQHASELVDSVQKALHGERTPLTVAPQTHFGYAGLAPVLPSPEDIEARAKSDNPNQRRWAEHMTATRAAMGRLPETVPMPIHAWQFGDQLTWIFLGGEVVSEYQMAIEKRLAGTQTWVAAYVDDVFAYVASERMRAEGGYEVDDSMIYYLQPGRWQAGTQELIERRVEELLHETQAEGEPLNAAEALQSIRVPDGFRVELIASEPMVKDPINVAFSPDGSAWVVEMADYPLGSGEGGRIKRLRDTDGNGTLDSVELFLTGLSYPTSVMPWRDGAIVIAAPDVLFARDTSGDGVADEREVLLTGIAESNPQHRASGFAVGLDGWLNFTSGESTKELVSHRANKTYSVQHHDIAWNPDTGELRATAGDTQYIRARDDFGNWFGNSNSYPMYQFVVDSRYQTAASIAGDSKQHLLTPAVAPPVFPRSRTVDRFNDLFAFNRFTSACSSMIVRTPGLGQEMLGAALVCEPVHNLVARFQVKPAGSSFVGERFEADKSFDFFTSTDPFCRPVRAVNAPDGTVWILDMSRQVIEHPEWIPTAWQERLNVRSGEKLGRIYRVYHEGFSPKPLAPVVSKPHDLRSTELLPKLASDNGAIRELAQLTLMWSDKKAESPDTVAIATGLHRLAFEHPNPAVRAAALGCLTSIDALAASDLISALDDRDPRVVRVALELSEPLLGSSDPSTAELRKQIVASAEKDRGPQVDLQWLLTTLALTPSETEDKLATVAARSIENSWIIRSLSLCQDPAQAKQLCAGLLSAARRPSGLPNSVFADIQQCTSRLWSRLGPDSQSSLLNEHFGVLPANSNSALTPPQLLLLTAYSESKGDAKPDKARQAVDLVLRKITENSLVRMMNEDAPEAERLVLINLLGCGLVAEEQSLQAVAKLVDARQLPSVQEAALLAARRINSAQVGAMLIQLWPRLTAEARSVAATSLLTRKPWVEQLVAALEKGDIKPTDLDVATGQQLKSYGDRKIRTRCELVFGKPTARASVVTQFMSEMPKNAKPEDGKQSFADNCAVCHRPAEGKPLVGPSIDNLGHWSVEQWVTAILDPNRAIEPKFHHYIVLTVDGQVLAGVIQQRTAQSVRLAAVDGSEREVALANIEEIRDTGVSLMPEGLETKLTPEKLAALIAFLRSR